jgi:hypothetical protein
MPKHRASGKMACAHSVVMNTHLPYRNTHQTTMTRWACSILACMDVHATGTTFCKTPLPVHHARLDSTHHMIRMLATEPCRCCWTSMETAESAPRSSWLLPRNAGRLTSCRRQRARCRRPSSTPSPESHDTCSRIRQGLMSEASDMLRRHGLSSQNCTCTTPHWQAVMNCCLVAHISALANMWAIAVLLFFWSTHAC